MSTTPPREFSRLTDTSPGPNYRRQYTAQPTAVGSLTPEAIESLRHRATMDRIAAESQLDAAAERLEFLEFIESRKKALPAQSNTNTAVLMMYGVAFLYMFTFPHDFWRFAPLAIVVGIHWVAIR